MKKIILDNIIFNIQKTGGISVFWAEMEKRILKDHRFDVQVYDYGNNKDNIEREKIQNCECMKKPKIRFKIKIERYLNLKGNLEEPAIFHSSYFRVMRGSKIKNVTMAYDFTYERYFPWLARFVHVWQKKRAFKNSAHIICISESTKSDLIHFYPQYQEKNISVIPLAYDRNTYHKIENIEKNEVAIFVGSRTHYKNFALAVESVALVSGMMLGIIGAPLNDAEKSLLKEKLNDRYQFHGYLNNTDLNVLYNQAKCLLYLSKYEGFGIPVLESMAAGCPVIALNKSSIPEVAGSAGILMDREESKEIAGSIEKILKDKAFESKLIEEGLKQAKLFSWDKTYEELAKIYLSI